MKRHLLLSFGIGKGEKISNLSRVNLEIAQSIWYDFSRQTDFIDLRCEREKAGTERPIKLTNANTSHLRIGGAFKFY